MRFSTLKALAPALAFIGSCQRTATGPSRVFALPVSGDLVAEDGSPVSGATVAVTPVALSPVAHIQTGKCSGSPGLPRIVISDMSGRFASELTGGGAPSLICVSVVVSPPSSSGLQVAELAADSVVLGPPGIGRDSLVFHVVLAR